MKKLALLIVASSLFIVSPVMAITGNTLLADCDLSLKANDEGNFTSLDRPDIVRVGRCYGYIEGAMNTYQFIMAGLKITPKYCMPPNVSKSQLVRVMVKYLEAHPERLHYNASSEVYAAFLETFPCN